MNFVFEMAWALIYFRSSHVHTYLSGGGGEDIIALSAIFKMLGSSLISDRLLHILFWN